MCQCAGTHLPAHLFPEDLVFTCAIRSRTYLKDGSYPLRAGACWIDDAFNVPTANWTLNSWSDMHADYEHDVKSDGLLPSRLLQNSRTSALIPMLVTYKHLLKCNYPRTSFGLLYFSIILRARSGQSPELFAARASCRRAVYLKGKTLISMVVATPVLSGARNMI